METKENTDMYILQYFINLSSKSKETEKPKDTPVETVPANLPEEHAKDGESSKEVRSKQEVSEQNESLSVSQTSETKYNETVEEPAPKDKDKVDIVKGSEDAKKKDVAKEDNTKGSTKKRSFGKKNHKPSPMQTDPTFVPRNSRYFCHDVRGETP